MNKILVANRGEIALRIMHSIKDLGLKSVAVYSEADRDAPFVIEADEAICIGPAPSDQSYLRVDKLIDACKATCADAIHPGYGFISENAEAAEAIINAGITFIGPRPESIRTMGSKLDSKKAVEKYNIPLPPGTKEALTDIKAAKEAAKSISYPVLIKASNGGGGKGMRLVEKEENLEEETQLAINEAESAFGNGAVFIEKYISSPKHIEVQILADKEGQTIHLFDRECSVQRRHQKVVEEAPSPSISSEKRNEICQCAILVAKSCNYMGAGTVEFLYDKNTHNFYFLEMNTRLQVEHPTTELITGVDLVKEQINIAQGKKLAIKQENLYIKGHAIEARVYAEDTENNFMPSTGLLEVYQKPSLNHVRVDDGYRVGMKIPIYYDPMISKLIAHGKNREEAIRTITKAIDHYKIKGISTTLAFCRFVINHPVFKDASFDTHFVAKHYDKTILVRQRKALEEAAAAALTHFLNNHNQKLMHIKKPTKNWSKRAKI